MNSKLQIEFLRVCNAADALAEANSAFILAQLRYERLLAEQPRENVREQLKKEGVEG